MARDHLIINIKPSSLVSLYEGHSGKNGWNLLNPLWMNVAKLIPSDYSCSQDIYTGWVAINWENSSSKQLPQFLYRFEKKCSGQKK